MRNDVRTIEERRNVKEDEKWDRNSKVRGAGRERGNEEKKRKCYKFVDESFDQIGFGIPCWGERERERL